MHYLIQIRNGLDLVVRQVVRIISGYGQDFIPQLLLDIRIFRQVIACVSQCGSCCIVASKQEPDRSGHNVKIVDKLRLRYVIQLGVLRY